MTNLLLLADVAGEKMFDGLGKLLREYPFATAWIVFWSTLSVILAVLLAS